MATLVQCFVAFGRIYTPILSMPEDSIQVVMLSPVSSPSLNQTIFYQKTMLSVNILHVSGVVA
jgi:hypothetical protein